MKYIMDALEQGSTSTHRYVPPNIAASLPSSLLALEPSYCETNSTLLKQAVVNVVSYTFTLYPASPDSIRYMVGGQTENVSYVMTDSSVYRMPMTDRARWSADRLVDFGAECRTNKTCWTDRKVPPFAFDTSRNVLWLVEDGKVKRLVPAHVTHSHDVRVGACGRQFDASRQIMAAVSHTLWTLTLANRLHLDPLCNKCLDVTHKEKTIQVPIEDKCLGCDSGRVDLSLPAFTMLGNPDKVRLEGAVYEIVECDGNTTMLYAATSRTWPRGMTFGVTLSFVAFVLAATAAVAYLGIRHYMTGKEWEIPFEQVQMEEQIGQGSFGVVFRAYRYGPVAVKQLFAAKPPPSQRRAFRNEIRLLKSLRHTNVLGLLGVVTEPKLAIVTDWCHGSLYHQIHVAESEYESRTVYRFCKQIAEGMHYLHSKGVLHRDLKSGNILLTEAEGTTLKICDFGLSTVKAPRVFDKKAAKSPVGSVLWMAPEIINPRLKQGGSPYSVQSDAYAFGICMFELLSRRLPYVGYERDQITYLVGAGRLHPETEPSLKSDTNELVRLMQSCLAYDSNERPTFDEICTTIRNAEKQFPSANEQQERARIKRNESGYVTVPQHPED